jgi:uncharacterized protein YutE (UPF0331/DUF86 family)
VPTDDVVLNKAAAIERCILRIREVYAGKPGHLRDDLTRQESILLNLQRACESAIDLAMHLVRKAKLGIPQDSRNAFDLLVRAGHLDPQLAEDMKRMVGFRNIAVHDYVRLDLEIVQSIIEQHLDDLGRFASESIRREASG